MYKCFGCGHVFDDWETAVWAEHHGLSHGPFETMTGCPKCHAPYGLAVTCNNCNHRFLQEELHEGWCDECLKESLTYDRCLEYLQSMSDGIAYFMFEFFFESPCPESISPKLLITLREWFLRQKLDDQIRGCTDFLDLCRKFVLHSEGEIGKCAYAHWLNQNNGRRRA